MTGAVVCIVLRGCVKGEGSVGVKGQTEVVRSYRAMSGSLKRLNNTISNVAVHGVDILVFAYMPQ